MPKDHYVPQFYLRRFANNKGQLRVYRRSSGEWIRGNVSVKNVASVTDFYTIFTDLGESREVELWLSDVERIVGNLLMSGMLHKGKLTSDDRYYLSLFVALQHVRTDAMRSILEEIWDSSSRRRIELNFRYASEAQLKNQLRKNLGRSPEGNELSEYKEEGARISEGRMEPENHNYHVRAMVEVAAAAAPILSKRMWRLLTWNERVLVTSDSPVMLYNETDQTGGLIGSDAVLLPIDSRTCLFIDATGSPSTELLDILPGELDHAVQINQMTALNCHEWIYADERIDHPLRGIVVPEKKIATYINGIPVYQGESSWDVLRAHWLPALDRYWREERMRGDCLD